MPLAEKSIFITGVSSGIGNALAHKYLAQGCRVLGVSRRKPEDLVDHSCFSFQSVDLGKRESIATALLALLDDTEALDVAILNAGMLGAFGDLRELQIDALMQVLDVNLWANKEVLDVLFSALNRIDQVVTISSGASVNGNRGWAGYSISKAALNMMTLLYARERPQTHFCALAPGLVDSEIQEELASIPPDDRFPSLEVIGNKRGTPEMPKPNEAGNMLADIIGRLPDLIESGAYADIRTPPLADFCTSAARTEE